MLWTPVQPLSGPQADQKRNTLSRKHSAPSQSKYFPATNVAGASVVSPDSKRKHQELNAFCENLNRISPVLQLQDDSITQIQSNQEQEDHKSLFKLYKQKSEKGRNSQFKSHEAA